MAQDQILKNKIVSVKIYQRKGREAGWWTRVMLDFRETTWSGERDIYWTSSWACSAAGPVSNPRALGVFHVVAGSSLRNVFSSYAFIS